MRSPREASEPAPTLTMDGMDEDFPRRTRATASRSRSPARAFVAAGLVAFLLGAVGMWFLSRPGSIDPVGIFQTSDQVEVPVVEPVASSDFDSSSTTPVADPVRDAARVEQVAEQQGGLDQRIAAMEQRLARLDLQAEAAAGNAARAEGLLIVFATRRSIERGAPLGYLVDQLRLRFGEARPNSVQTVIDGARNPVTLDQLLAKLDGLAPSLRVAPRDEGAFAKLRRELGDLFVVRRENAPSPAAESRLERARLFLESGRPDAAAAEVRNLPNAARASGWIADAERYARVQRALELLELTAILEPRELRNAAGERVEQPSPAEQTTPSAQR